MGIHIAKNIGFFVFFKYIKSIYLNENMKNYLGKLIRFIIFGSTDAREIFTVINLFKLCRYQITFFGEIEMG